MKTTNISIFNDDCLKKLKDKPVSVYVFSYTKDFSKEEFGDLGIKFTLEAIPEKITT